MPENRKFHITIDGEAVEVTEEIYRAYKRPAWTGRKRSEVRAEHELSLDVFEGSIASPCDDIDTKMALDDALQSLTAEERTLIISIFFEGMTEREIAEIQGIAQKNINKKKQRILEKLKKILS